MFAPHNKAWGSVVVGGNVVEGVSCGWATVDDVETNDDDKINIDDIGVWNVDVGLESFSSSDECSAVEDCDVCLIVVEVKVMTDLVAGVENVEEESDVDMPCDNNDTDDALDGSNDTSVFELLCVRYCLVSVYENWNEEVLVDFTKA